MRHAAALMVVLAVVSGSLLAQAPTATPGAGLTTQTATTYSVSVAAGATLANCSLTFEELVTPENVQITSITGTAPTGVTINPDPGTLPTGLAASQLFELTGTVAASNTPGDFVFTITVDDAGTQQTVFTVTLTLTNSNPTMSAGTDAVSGTGTGGDPFDSASQTTGTTPVLALAEVDDVNSGQTLALGTITPGGGNPSAVFNITSNSPAAGATLIITATAGSALAGGDVGTHTFNIIVNDGGGGTVAVNISIVVAAANVAPVLGAPSGTVDLNVAGTDPNFTATCVVGDDLSITFGATDANGADNLDLTVTRTAGSLASIAAAGFTGATTDSGTSPVSVTLGGTASTAGTITLQIDVDDNAGGTDTYTIAITITAPGTPNITVTGALTAFTTTGTGVPSTEQSYTVSGADLTADIVITAPTHFQVSTTGGGVGFGTSVNLTPAGGTVGNTTIFVRYNPSVTGSHNGNITHTSTGATLRNQAVSGSVNAPTAASLSTGSGNPGSKNVSPGSTSSALVFRINETGGGTAYTLTGASIDIATLGNTGGQAVVRIASVQLRRGSTVLGTITNGGAGWSVAGDIVTVNFTGLSNSVSAGSSVNYTLTITFTGAAIPTPRPQYIASVTAADITGSVVLTGTSVTGGTLTLAESTPDDPFADDDTDEEGCELAVGGGPAWPALALLMLAGVLAVARRRRA